MKEELVLLIFYSFLLGGPCLTGGSMLDKYSRRPGGIYHGRYTRNIQEPELLIPRRVFEDGSFHTFSLPEYYDRQELSDRKKRTSDGDYHVDKLHLVLPIEGANHHIELTPYHDFISPEMVFETRGDQSNADLNDGVRFKRAPNQQCHYRGFLRGDPSARAALSLCEGVAGYVQTNQGRFFIEPVGDAEPGEDGQHVHMAYKREAPQENDQDQSKKRSCGTSDDWESAWAEQLYKRRERLANGEVAFKGAGQIHASSHSIHRFIELGLFIDRRFLDFHNGTDYETYILTIMNMSSDFYHDVTSGNQMDLVIVRIVYLERQDKEIDLYISPEAEKTLESFSAWADKMNPKDFNHPNHHDIAVLITRYDICSTTDSACGLLGLAYMSAACDPPKAACINEDNGLALGIVITHEVGHVLGSPHDEEAITGCSAKDKDGSFFIMSPSVFIYTLRWSPCSRKFMTEMLDSGLGDCLNDDPKNPPERYRYPMMLPGAMYDANFQCSMDFPGSTERCYKGQSEVCTKLWCKVSGVKCLAKGTVPAEGTKCGENKWCIHKECVEMGARPNAVHGGWGSWGPMGQCSRTCGGGGKFSERECDNPKPANGGRYCLGLRKRVEICNVSPCSESQPPFRAVQCAEYNNKEVTADGMLHKWTPYFTEDGPSCVLYCINEINNYMKLSPSVKDGTPCKPGTNYMCIGAVCRKVGCDWVLDSENVEDKCGICKGDGSRCRAVKGFFDKTGLRGYSKVVTIPKGSRSIWVSESGPSINILALKPERGDSYCLNGDNVEQRNGDFPCAGAVVIYNHPQKQKEQIEIKGPITEDVQLQYAFYNPKENPGVNYMYYVPNMSKASQPSNYLWDFLEWTKCDAKCGGGSQESDSTCIEQQAGKVSTSFCQGIPRPPHKTRKCNEQPCPAKWRVSQWSNCSACGGKKGQKRRKVQCVKSGQRTGSDDVQSNLDACKGSAPKQSMDCVGERPCRRTCSQKRRRDTEDKGHQSKALDQYVDLGLQRYLENPKDDLGHHLRDSADNAGEKYKRTCDGRKTRERKPEKDLPKAGSIVMDPAPPESIVLYEVPYKDEFMNANMSDIAFQEAGDSDPVQTDSKQEKVLKGEEAVKRMKEMAHHGESSSRGPDGQAAGNIARRDLSTQGANATKMSSENDTMTN